MSKQILTKGFTLTEILVVVGIIGILSSIVLVSLSGSKEKAKVSKEIAQIQELKKAAQMYYLDTKKDMPLCGTGCPDTCTALSDPLFTAPTGVSNWKGPYIPGGLWNRSHQWGGAITVAFSDVDPDSPGSEYYVFLDEDAPTRVCADNTGRIPLSALQEIDRKLDDGDLGSGKVRGNGGGFDTAVGEVVIVFDL